MSATSRAVRVTEGTWGTLASQRSRSSGWASLEISLPPCGGGPGSLRSALMDSVTVEVAARRSVPSASRNDGSDVLKSAPTRGRQPPGWTASVTLPRSLGLLHGDNELKWPNEEDL